MDQLLSNILTGINSIVHSYGWSVAVFTLLIRFIIFPLDYKSRVSMRKTTKLQPEIARIQKKYAKDQDKMNQKMSELYKKEHINPLSSCLPMLISLPVLYAMFAAMRLVANQNLVQQVFAILQGNDPTLEGWLWVKNIFMPDSPFAACWPDLGQMRAIPTDVWTNAFSALQGTNLLQDGAWVINETLTLTADSFTSANLSATIQSIYDAMCLLPHYQAATAVMPGATMNLIFTTVSVMQNFNGFFILPVLSAVSQYVMTLLTPTQQPAANTGTQSAGTGAFMKWFFPLFSLWICCSYNALFAIYWVVSNLIALVQTWGINKYLDAKEAKQKDVEAEVSIK